MLQKLAESLLLSRAVSHGLLKRDDLAGELPSGGISTRWGPRVDFLIEQGRLSEEAVKRLAALTFSTNAADAASDRTIDGQALAGRRPPETTMFNPPPGMPLPLPTPTPGVTTIDAAPEAPPSEPPLALAGTIDSTSAELPVHTLVSVEGFPLSNWDKYEFLHLLGRGGMGTVYKARDRRLGRILALKFIHREDPGQVQRFMQEARAQARLDHPHICKIPGGCRNSDGIA